MSYMTEECYTAHPWTLAAKWHQDRVRILHYVTGNPCSAIAFLWVQWSKLMSHFCSGRTSQPMISIFFSFSWERQFILQKIVVDFFFCLCFLLSEDMYCAALAFLLNPSKCRSLVHFSVFVCGWMCVCVCVFAFIQLLCDTGKMPWLLHISLLCTKYLCLVAKIWEILFLR